MSQGQPSKASLYLDLLKKSLTDFHHVDTYELYPLQLEKRTWKTALLLLLDKLLRRRNFVIAKRRFVYKEKRANGYDWPAQAATMIGLNRLDNIEMIIRTICQEGIQGDLLEAGVWRGGATIFMRAVLKELDVQDRKVYVADSFEGLPVPDPSRYKADKGNILNQLPILKVDLETVKGNFEKYGLLDAQVVFLKGWFKDTLPHAPINKLALLRVDADMYGSTMEVLENLYPKLMPGGFVIIDDYNAFPFCKQATEDYRRLHQITEPIQEIDKEAVFWRKGMSQSGPNFRT